MPKANTASEIEIKVFDRPRTFAFRGRSLRALSTALRRESERNGPQLGRIASLLDVLAEEGWRYGGLKGHVVTLIHPQSIARAQIEAFLSARCAPDLLSRVTV